MTEEQIFFEIHSGLPRQGPGDARYTRRAFELLKGLPEKPVLLDVGCGTGKQTLDLAGISDCVIHAVDLHQPFLDILEQAVAHRDLGGRIHTARMSMERLDFEAGSFDCIWAEGSIYIMGFESALRKWKRFLKPDGYIAVTEVSWLKPNPPEVVKEFWNDEYPDITDVRSNCAAIESAGYELIDSFPLPEEAWWSDYYTPLQKNVDRLKKKYSKTPAAIPVFEMVQREMDLFRDFPEWYGYVFYVMRSAEQSTLHSSL